jgi:ribosomal protein S4E
LDTNAKLSIASAALSFATGGVGAGDPRAWGAIQNRLAGRTVVAISTITTSVLSLGWDSDTSSIIRDGFRLSASSSTTYDNGTTIDTDTLAAGTAYRLATVMRGTGFYTFVKGGAFTNWTLCWVSATGTSSMYPAVAVATSTVVGTLDSFRVLDLAAPFDTDYGLATDRKAGSVALATTFTHEGNAVIEFTNTTLPLGNFNCVDFRIQDSNNYWRILIGSTGAFDLQEYVAGSPTYRAQVPAVVSSGHRVVIVADGTTIRGYSNNVLRWTYSSATNFQTATGGKLSSLGSSGGVVSDIVSFPRTITGSAATLLDNAAAGTASTYLLNDEFTTDDTAPLDYSTRTAEPTGTLTITDTAKVLSVAGGALVSSAKTGDNNPNLQSVTQFARLAGRAFVSTVTDNTFRQRHGFYTTAALDSFTQVAIFDFTSIYLGTTNIDTTFTAVNGTKYSYAIVLRTSGAFYFVKGGTYTSWMLVWVDTTQTTATLTLGLSVVGASTLLNVDMARVLDLPAPYTDSYGLATQRLAGARAALDTFVHEANCVIEWTQTTLPASAAINFTFRQQDSSNKWQINISSGGTIDLYEIVATVATLRGNSASVVSNGHRIVVVCDGSTIRVYSNNVLRITYSSASSFATSTAGVLLSLGTGGAVSDIVSWPRTLTGAAASYLDGAVA